MVEKRKANVSKTFDFEVKFVGSITAKNKENARQKISEETEIENIGKKDYLEIISLQG